MATMKQEMEFFVAHHHHVTHHKEQTRILLRDFGNDEVVIKADFIQNIVHMRGVETQQAYFGKRQTQFLCFVVWYRCKVDGTDIWECKKQYFDYLSSYLAHNSLYFQKCCYHLLIYIREELGVNVRRVCKILFCLYVICITAV